MSYQRPAYYLVHAARDALAGDGAITAPNAFVGGTGAVSRLADGLLARLLAFSSAELDHRIDLDRGTGTLEDVSHLIIPPGGNWVAILVESSTTGAFGGEQTGHGTAVPVGGAGGYVFHELTNGPTDDRYWRFTFPVLSVAYELGELYLSNRVELAPPQADWDDGPVAISVVAEFPLGESVVELAPPRQSVSYTWRNLTGADLVAMDALIAATISGGRGFYLETADDADPPRFVRLAAVRRRRQDHPVPAISVAYQVGLTFIEQLR